MSLAMRPQIRSTTRPPLRGGFSFTEILFAVMILGIGFIMVAAMFPVAIHQTEASNSETIGAAVGKQGSSVMTQVAAMNWPPAGTPGFIPTSMLLPTFAGMTALPAATTYTLPSGQNSMVVPGQVWSMYDSRDKWTYTNTSAGGLTYNHQILLWDAVARNLIQPGDPRFGWAVLYRRDLIVQGQPGSPAGNISIAPYAQVFVVAMQSRAKQTYSSATDIQTPPTASTPFWPQYVSGVTVAPPTFAGGPSTITFPTNPALVAENTYVIVSYAYTSGGGIGNTIYNGHVYRIGNARSPGVWEFLPGQGLSVGDPSMMVDVFVVGRGIDTTNGGKYGGLAQDISVYTTYVQIPN
jgi:hypothetical protein